MFFPCFAALVTYALNDKGLGVAVGDAFNHVVEQRSCKTVESLGLRLVVGTSHMDNSVLHIEAELVA